LAAKFPGDAGIDKHSSVLFADRFEAANLAEVLSHYNDGSDIKKDILALVRDGPTGTGRCIQMTSTLGENTGGFLYKKLPREVEKMFVRFYVKFPKDVDYIHHFFHIGGYHPATNWAQGGAGERPKGNDRITVGIEPTGDHGRLPAPGMWNLYCYWNEMKVSAGGKYWGNSLEPIQDAIIPKDKWQCVEVMIKLNDPAKRDGELALWIDGKLSAHIYQGVPRAQWTGMGFRLLEKGGEPFEGFRWRTSNDLKLNFVWLLHYVTENAARANNSTPKKTNRVWFDNVVVATEYVGPVAR
jgi:hypothetical protein